MARLDLTILTCVACLHLLLPAGTLLPSPPPTLTTLRAIERRFVDEVHGAGVKTPRPAPSIQFETAAILATYNADANAIHILRWNSAPLPAKATFNLMAIYCKDGITGEKLFAESYGRLFFAHELGHWLQLQFHRGPIDQYRLEMEANRIAVAFWSARPDDRAWLRQMVERYKLVRSQFPNPVPKGQDPGDYFNRNWKKWVQDGRLEYGAYQIRMIIDAWDERNRPAFAEIARQVRDSQ